MDPFPQSTLIFDPRSQGVNLSKYNFIRTIMNNSPNRTSLIKVYRTRLTNYTKGLFYFIRARESLSGDLNMRKIKIEKETILQNFQGQRIFIFYRSLLQLLHSKWRWSRNRELAPKLEMQQTDSQVSPMALLFFFQLNLNQGSAFLSIFLNLIIVEFLRPNYRSIF